MARHREELTADFVRFYGGTPRQLWERGCTVIEVAGMARHLPPESATARALNPHHEWTVQAVLTAQLINEQRRLAWLYETTHAKRRPPAPEWVRLPWDTSQAPDRDVIKGDAFDSVQDAEDWYAARYPERAAELRAITARHTAG